MAIAFGQHGTALAQAGFAALIVLCLAVLPVPAFAVDCPRDGSLIAGAGDYRPYNIVEGDSVSGMDFEVIEAILDKMGCGLTKVPLPWARHLNAMQNGLVDIASPVTITPERESFARFTDPYITANEILFVATDTDPAYDSLQSFFEAGNRLGVIREYAYGGTYPALSAAYAGQIETTDSLELNLKQLMLGRVDAILGETYVVTAEINKLRAGGKIKPTEVVVASEPNFIMFAKKSVPADFVAAFNTQLQAMKRTGEFDRITEKYRSTQAVY
ncbi:substrate-binding periplasmic protein [Roseibium sediminicola]|uniref:Transporter substrate-binding domain-containing protein n=1 Tax=Roseibium sediminicola TaxID=2933272 RepID=A0ABT0H304_9HYPH|nr:transporter substrate-binding domain-containing protein [Roseibium sp. CAU 1639]MCK7615463.1 transporter substrate-binding domain-containing protein [Roseibium sp. CAU 1639]